MPFLGKQTSSQDPVGGLDRVPVLKTAIDWARDVSVPGVSQRPSRGLQPGAERQTCGNIECNSRWRKPWKNRSRPIFEDNWGCSTKCLEAIVRKSLKRERGDRNASLQEEEPHRHRLPLGLVMLSQGWITQAQLRKALDAQRAAGEGKIGFWLQQECGLNQAMVTRALALQWSCPVLPMDGFTPSAMALTMPRLFVEDFHLLPLRVAGSRILYIAYKDRLSASAGFAIEQMSGLRVENGLLDEASFDGAYARLLESKFIPAGQEFVADTDTLSEKIAGILEQTQPVGSRLVRVQQHYWLRTWLETGAYSGVGNLPSTGEDVNDIVFTLGARA